MRELAIEEKQDRKTSILIADDHPLFRKAVRDILEKQPDIELVFEAGDGEEAIELVAQTSPDVIIMDISMPQINGLEATRRIKAQFPDIAVLILTVHNDMEHILSILDAGASGYLTKSASISEVVAAVRAIIAGETVITTQVFKQVLKHTMRYPIKPITLPGEVTLTARELEVFKLAGEGLTNKDIALKLNLSLRTIKGYMVEILSKLNAKSRTEAVIIGLRKGLITSDNIE